MVGVASGRVGPKINEINVDGKFFLSVGWVSQELAKEGKIDLIRLIRRQTSNFRHSLSTGMGRQQVRPDPCSKAAILKPPLRLKPAAHSNSQ